MGGGDGPQLRRRDRPCGQGRCSRRAGSAKGGRLSGRWWSAAQAAGAGDWEAPDGAGWRWRGGHPGFAARSGAGGRGKSKCCWGGCGMGTAPEDGGPGGWLGGMGHSFGAVPGLVVQGVAVHSPTSPERGGGRRRCHRARGSAKRGRRHVERGRVGGGAQDAAVEIRWFWGGRGLGGRVGGTEDRAGGRAAGPQLRRAHPASWSGRRHRLPPTRRRADGRGPCHRLSCWGSLKPAQRSRALAIIPR
jgi:hypothetical protein